MRYKHPTPYTCMCTHTIHTMCAQQNVATGNYTSTTCVQNGYEIRVNELHHI